MMTLLGVMTAILAAVALCAVGEPVATTHTAALSEEPEYEDALDFSFVHPVLSSRKLLHGCHRNRYASRKQLPTSLAARRAAQNGLYKSMSM